MNKMMSVAAFAAALTLTASCALAATADAKIVAPNTEKITAPFAGTLLPFDYETGDSVSAHETLFTLDTTPVYATQAGTVSAVFASVGDDASGVAAHYGALAVIEPKNALYIDASTDQAYNDADNRYIHAGEYVYYVHSYYGTNCAESTLAVSDYSIPVTGVVRAGRVYGTQFHPEKSGDTGLRILKAFSEL